VSSNLLGPASSFVSGVCVSSFSWHDCSTRKAVC
jgi:hypothetical protein